MHFCEVTLTIISRRLARIHILGVGRSIGMWKRHLGVRSRTEKKFDTLAIYCEAVIFFTRRVLPSGYVPDDVVICCLEITFTIWV